MPLLRLRHAACRRHAYAMIFATIRLDYAMPPFHAYYYATLMRGAAAFRRLLPLMLIIAVIMPLLRRHCCCRHTPCYCHCHDTHVDYDIAGAMLIRYAMIISLMLRHCRRRHAAAMPMLSLMLLRCYAFSRYYAAYGARDATRHADRRRYQLRHAAYARHYFDAAAAFHDAAADATMLPAAAYFSPPLMPCFSPYADYATPPLMPFAADVALITLMLCSPPMIFASADA